MLTLDESEWEEYHQAYFIQWILSRHPNCVTLRNIYRNGQTMYVVGDWMDYNLGSVIEDERFTEEESKRLIVKVFSIIR